MAVIDSGNNSAGKANVTSTYDLQVALPDAATPSRVGGLRIFSENDTGDGLGGDAWLQSPETDLDYRMRLSQDSFLEDETFNYTAQNTGKYQYYNTTMTNAWTTAGMTTNSGAITTTTTGTMFRSYAFFPLFGTTTTAADFELSLSAAATANTTIDFGIGLTATSNPYAPTDGAYFRLTSAGLQGVVNFNGTETTTSVFSFAHTASKKYQFILYIHRREVQFWINNGVSTDLYGRLSTPSGNGQPMCAASGQIFIRHAIAGGAAGAALSAQLSAWNVRVGGWNITRSMAEQGNACYGSYQGLGGGTMGSLANYANSANPTAAVPTNTTAALGTGLGGQFWETATIALNTDGIIQSYQVPAGTVSVPGRRLVIYGVSLQSYIQTVIAGGPFNTQYSLAFGHTAVSLATAEAATTKAPRRIALPEFTQLVTSAQAVNTMVSQPGGATIKFTAPIYVNPGEFVALVAKKVGTVGTSGVIAHMVSYHYGWG